MSLTSFVAACALLTPIYPPNYVVYPIIRRSHLALFLQDQKEGTHKVVQHILRILYCVLQRSGLNRPQNEHCRRNHSKSPRSANYCSKFQPHLIYPRIHPHQCIPSPIPLSTRRVYLSPIESRRCDCVQRDYVCYLGRRIGFNSQTFTHFWRGVTTGEMEHAEIALRTTVELSAPLSRGYYSALNLNLTWVAPGVSGNRNAVAR